MIKPIRKKTDSPDAYQQGYQQALDDFGISQLLERLSNVSDFHAQSLLMQEQELNSLAALLVAQLTVTLKENLIAGFLNALRYGDVIASSPLFEGQLSQSIELPTHFSVPLYWCGDRLRWKPLSQNPETDFGTAIGRFYLPAAHQGGAWTWKYLILLDKDSPSSNIAVADTAWEDDLEPLEKEEAK